MALVEQLRRELAERPVIDAHRCPSWPAHARGLRAAGHVELATWLEDDLVAAWGEIGVDRRRARARAASSKLDVARPDVLVDVWRGRIGWSWWVGPFPVACVGEIDLQATFGPLATFLLPERVFGGAEAEALVESLAGGGRIAIPTSTRAEQRALHGLLAAASERVHGRGPVDEAGLSLRWMRMRRLPQPPAPRPGEHGLLAPTVAKSVDGLHPPALSALASVIVLGPPELLARVPLDLELRPWSRPQPSFVDRHAALIEAEAGLFGCLQRELAGRPLAQAHTCPSWPVVLDWLLESGHAQLGRWLRAALVAAGEIEGDADAAARSLAQLASRGTQARFPATRAPIGDQLRQLWAERRERGVHWFGPFVLACFDPELERGLGALELQLALGRHATLLAPERVYTSIQRGWLLGALDRGPGPTLAPMPIANASETIANQLAALGQRDEGGVARTMRIVAPGSRAESWPERRIATNIGPIAADREATALLCCEDLADIERHAEDWDRLAGFDRVIVLATPDLLERWPHGGRRLAPFGG